MFFHRLNGSKVADITMKEAVDYLSSTEETYQHCGASYIQHNTFIDDKAKEEVPYFVLITSRLLSYSDWEVKRIIVALKMTKLKEIRFPQVLKLNGIAPLVNLLRSPSLQVNSTASAALRNLSFKNDKNKEEIRRCGGITQAAALLREADSLELQKQLTGTC